MKKALAWLLVLSMTAALAVGGTLAYLTDTDEDVNVMTVGQVLIDQLEYERVDPETNGDDAKVQEFHNNKPLYPAVTEDGFNWDTTNGSVSWDQIGKDGYTSNIWDPADINNEQDKMVFVKNKGDFDAYVRTVFAFEAGSYTDLTQYQADVHLNLNEEDYVWEWAPNPITIGGGNYFVATATYKYILKPGALTEISLSQIALDPSVTNQDIEAFGETFQVLVNSQAVQADGFTDPAIALNEAFGAIDTTVDPPEIPFEGDASTTGEGLYNALHYLNANPSGTDISTSITSIVFGDSAEYPEIVNNNKGYLVDQEQDVDAYVYYVNDQRTRAAGDQYTLYVLSSDKIYAPKDSTRLFYNMQNLVSVNTTALDVSRVENAYQMFRNCHVLKSLDTTKWDVSSIKDMTGMFYMCYALSEIKGMENWNTSNVENMYCLFYKVNAITELDLSGWDMSKVKNISYMAANNDNLVTINATGWDLSSVENAGWAFRVNPKLKNVIGSGDWTLPNVTTTYGMFLNCASLESIDVHNWDMSKNEITWDMFCGCTSLITVPGIGNWDLSSAKQVISMFNGASNLQYLEDLSGWGMNSAEDMGYMFYGCKSLTELNGLNSWETESLLYLTYMFGAARGIKSLDLSNWDVSKVIRFNSMFSSSSQNSGNMALESINMSGWNPVSAEEIGWMFYGCGNLVTIDMSGWNMPNLRHAGHMFADCFKLENINLTDWYAPKVQTVDGMFNDCRVLKTIDMSSFTMSECKEFSQMFEACYALEYIIGLENWDTSKACTFTEMFSGCNSLKELNLSNMDTSGAFDNYTDMNNSTSHAFVSMFSGLYSLEKLILGDKINFFGNGNVAANRKMSLPTPSRVTGWDGKWYNAETGEAFAPSEIPEKTAATYVAVKPE